MEEVRQDQRKSHTRSPERAASTTVETHNLAEGEIVSERYKIKSLIGQGGMGSVYLVEQIFLHKLYALKTLHPAQMSETAWRRFQKEAQTIGALHHPCLLNVYDFGMIDEEQPFFVMDYCEGDTLSHYLDLNGVLPIPAFYSVFQKVCSALAHAHEKGVVHRDIKPSNIIIEATAKDEYNVRVVDFGIAKLTSALEQESNDLTRTGEVFGTPFYMSPEQCLGIAIDHRADIYSLGCVMYQALTGSTPFVGDTPLSIMMQHQGAVPVSLKEASLGRTYPAQLESIVQKMLAKDPADRYQNLSDVVNDLGAAKLGRRVLSVTPEMVGKKKRIDLAFKIFGGVSAFLGVAAMSFVIGRTSAPLKSTYNILPVHITAAQEQVIGAKDRALTDAANKDGKYFSSFDEPSKRTFHFNKSEDDAPGIMIFPNSVDCMTAQALPDGLKKIYAVGDVIVNNFQPFELIAGDTLADNPSMLTRFRADEVNSLAMTSALPNVFHDDAVAQCVHLKSIERVKLEASIYLTDASLNYLEQLPNLVQLQCSKTAITGSGVGKMHNIQKFTALDLSSLRDDSGSDVLPALKNSKAMRDLNLRRGAMDDEELDLISTIENLEKLDISGTVINDRNIGKLAALKHLRSLNVYDAPKLTPKCLATLAKFPALKTLCIGMSKKPNQWTDALPKFAEEHKGQIEICSMD
ncbi:MAG TPA: serine/threonine-protein kinase [Drouetiella sp.]